MFNSINDVPDSTDRNGKKHLGKVVFNDDPLMVERIKVHIEGLFSGPHEDLPWIGRSMTSPIPGSSQDQFGTFNLPPRLGAEVTVVFQEGNTLYGLYEAYPVQTDERPIEGKTNYLYRYGHKDPRGNLIFLDTKPDASPQFYLKLAAGVELQVDAQANLSLVINGNASIQVKGNLSADVKGTTSVSSAGATTVSSQASISVQAPSVDIN